MGGVETGKGIDRTRFVRQSNDMDNNWAADNLHVIRTLMERSALYRRALAPIMFYLGVLGIAAGALAWYAGLGKPLPFVIFWGAVGISGLAGSFLLARRQAIKDAEPFWSPPTRHVSQALLPSLVAGSIFGLLGIIAPLSAPFVALLPAVWMVLHGCALTSAGFFMRRGMQVLGWVFLLLGCGLLGVGVWVKGGMELLAGNAHLLMGGTFGALHLACGIYLLSSKDNGEAL